MFKKILIANRGEIACRVAATDLIRAIANKSLDDAVVDDTARRIATQRATPEAKEGLTAFLEKRPAAWIGEKRT